LHLQWVYFFANAKSKVSKKAQDEMKTRAEGYIAVISLKIVYENPR